MHVSREIRATYTDKTIRVYQAYNKHISELTFSFIDKSLFVVAVIPEYTYGFECGSKIVLSSEHNGFEWLTYDEAITRLTWDSNKTALYELNCRLLEACQIGGLEGNTC